MTRSQGSPKLAAFPKKISDGNPWTGKVTGGVQRVNQLTRTGMTVPMMAKEMTAGSPLAQR